MMAITATAMTPAQPRDGAIRRAGAGDGEALARLIGEPVIALDGSARDIAGIALAELANPDIETLVVDAQEGLQGFLQLRWGRRPPSAQWMRGSAEVRRHYVRARHRGAGVAVRLLQHAIELARSREAACLWLKVDKDAMRAVRFYRKHGFRLAGTALFMVAGRQREHWVMHRVLVAPQAVQRSESPRR